jgi:hypothetical protein
MGAAALAMVLGAAIAVRGAARCPTAAEVSDALAALSPPGGTPATGDWADIAPDGDSVRVRLLQADGTLLAEKRLVAGSCRQQAETAAVVLAAWASQFHPEVAFSFETAPPARSTPAAGPPTLVATPSPPAPRDRAPLVLAAGAGVLASVQGDSLAPAGTIEARLAAAQSGWGARLAFRATGTHRLTLGPGDAAWRRVGVSAGVLRRQAWRRVFAEAAVDVVSGLLFVEGDGYSVGRSARSLDVGAEAGARLGLPLGRIEPWFGVSVCAWLRPQVVEVAGIPERDRLPAFDARVGIGANVAFGR